MERDQSPTKFGEVITALEPGKHHVAILFTDIRGFSRMVERETKRLGVHAAVALKEQHDEPIQKHLDLRSYLKTVGDGCLFLFSDVCEPIGPAIDLQREFRDRNDEKEPDYRVEVRIGIHTGDVVIREGNALSKWGNDALGDAVNLASRVTETAPVGTIHLTNSAYESCLKGGPVAPGKASLNDMGMLTLRGRKDPCHIWQINPFGGRLAADMTKQIDGPDPLLVGGAAFAAGFATGFGAGRAAKDVDGEKLQVWFDQTREKSEEWFGQAKATSEAWFEQAKAMANRSGRSRDED